MPSPSGLASSLAPDLDAHQVHPSPAVCIPTEVSQQARPVHVVKEEEAEVEAEQDSNTNLGPATQKCSHCGSHPNTSRPIRSHRSKFQHGVILCSACSMHERVHASLRPRADHSTQQCSHCHGPRGTRRGLLCGACYTYERKNKRRRPQTLIERAQAQRL
ncbi:hypothetical protein B0H17DRAFT_1088581, partial [Mycena rosella]